MVRSLCYYIDNLNVYDLFGDLLDNEKADNTQRPINWRVDEYILKESAINRLLYIHVSERSVSITTKNNLFTKLSKQKGC